MRSAPTHYHVQVPIIEMKFNYDNVYNILRSEVVDYNKCNSVWISRVVRDVPIKRAFVRKVGMSLFCFFFHLFFFPAILLFFTYFAQYFARIFSILLSISKN